MKDKEKQIEEIFDILNKFEFFQGQRAGRELWNDKPKEVQDKDISDFVRDINYIRSYLQDSVVLSREEYESDLTAQYDVGYEFGSKETAERDFNTIIKALEDRKQRVKAFYGIVESIGADIAIRTVKELAKQYGGEIEK